MSTKRKLSRAGERIQTKCGVSDNYNYFCPKGTKAQMEVAMKKFFDSRGMAPQKFNLVREDGNHE